MLHKPAAKFESALVKHELISPSQTLFSKNPEKKTSVTRDADDGGKGKEKIR